tara:strand:- start:509 stop:661 length:153 start_codon:yes stop_codon:yes gene_type:complete
MPHMYNHTDANRIQTVKTKQGMKIKKDTPKKKPTVKKTKPMGKAKKTISY